MAKRRKRSSTSSKAPTAADRGPRVMLLYGLSGLFTVVAAGLIVGRPGPLASPVLAASVDRTSSDHRPVPLDDALTTNVPVRAGSWSAVRVRTLPAGEAWAVHPHFLISADGTAGTQLVVGTDWLQQRALNVDGEVLLVVSQDTANDPAVRTAVDGLVRRLCEQFSIDARQVRRS